MQTASTDGGPPAGEAVEAHWPMMTAVAAILAVLVIGWMVVRKVLLDGKR